MSNDMAWQSYGGSVLELPLDDNSFDVVLCQQGL